MKVKRNKRPIVLGMVDDLSDSRIEVSVSLVGGRPRYMVSAFGPTYGRAKFILSKDQAQEFASLLTEALFIGEPEEE